VKVGEFAEMKYDIDRDLRSRTFAADIASVPEFGNI
jgi:hypothetical protein